jgi:hypothetical protein
MSRFEGPQGIVTNGLVLNLDAGDPESYTRSQPPFVEVLVVAGGASGGSSTLSNGGGGGGGAGGVIYNSAYQLASAAAVTVTVGAGGAGQTTNDSQGNNGSNSVFGSLTAVGGGGGGGAGVNTTGKNGGSGGGAGYAGYYNNFNSGTGTAGQGFRGGYVLANNNAGGGGGAGGVGGDTFDSRPEPGYPAGDGGLGGPGVYYSISGTSTLYSTGGNGGSQNQNTIVSGSGTTGAYGGSGATSTAGSGIVIVRYPGLPAATGGTITYLNGYTIHTFTTSGTFTPYQWYSSTDSNTSGSLINGPVFNPQIVGGYFQFDGTDDYVLFGASIGATTTVSVEMWCKIPASYASDMFFGWNAYDVWCDNGNLGYNTNNGDVYGISAATVSSLGLVDNWKQYIFEMRSDVSYSNNKIYVNGVSQTLSQQGGSENSGNRNFNSGNGVFPGYRASLGSYLMSYQVGSFRVYNRALSAAEITQNFNAQRNRFGL